MIVYHYSVGKVEEINDVNCGNLYTYGRPSSKKIGGREIFWVSNLGKNSWKYCHRQYGMGPYNYRYTIKLRATRKSRILKNFKDIKKFESEYGHVSQIDGRRDRHNIRWQDVCRDLDLVYLAFYERDMDWHHKWYSLWNCTSGVIFKTRVIRSIKEEKVSRRR